MYKSTSRHAFLILCLALSCKHNYQWQPQTGRRRGSRCLREPWCSPSRCAQEIKIARRRYAAFLSPEFWKLWFMCVLLGSVEETRKMSKFWGGFHSLLVGRIYTACGSRAAPGKEMFNLRYEIYARGKCGTWPCSMRLTTATKTCINW